MNLERAENRRYLIQKIEELVLHLLGQVARLEKPVIEVRSVSRDKEREECVERVSMCNSRSVKKFAVIFKLLDEIHSLLETNAIATKRDLFYRDVNFYGKQETVDRNLDAIARMLDVPRWRLNVVATAKGLIVGNLTFLETAQGAFVNCALSGRTGVAIPSRVDEIKDLRSEAKFVILVEKDAIFQKLVDAQLVQKFNGKCLLVTGKGYADFGTRQLLHRLRFELNIPVFALMDADPHGLDIFLTYKYGTATTLFNELLTIPDLQLIGVFPHEITSLPVAPDQLIPLTMNERKILANLPQRIPNPGDPVLIHQIKLMEKCGMKMEIQGLYTIGEHYLVDHYLANRIVQALHNWNLQQNKPKYR